MPIIIADNLHKHMTELLGLPKHCKNYTIRMDKDRPVEIELTYYPEISNKETITTKYNLVEKNEENTCNNKDKT